jgi:hypothetical protein
MSGEGGRGGEGRGGFGRGGGRGRGRGGGRGRGRGGREGGGGGGGRGDREENVWVPVVRSCKLSVRRREREAGMNTCL